MDPGYLRQAVNDMVATTDAEVPQMPSIGDALRAAAFRFGETLEHLRHRVADSVHRAEQAPLHCSARSSACAISALMPPSWPTARSRRPGHQVGRKPARDGHQLDGRALLLFVFVGSPRGNLRRALRKPARHAGRLHPAIEFLGQVLHEIGLFEAHGLCAFEEGAKVPPPVRAPAPRQNRRIVTTGDTMDLQTPREDVAAERVGRAGLITLDRPPR